jgi:hypothetical protein
MTTSTHNTIRTNHNAHVNTHATEKPNFLARRAVALGLVGLAAFGVTKGVQNLAERSGGPHFTHEQLDDMPKQPIVVKPGQGAESILRSIEPGVLGHGQERADLIAYVNEQAANENGQLAEHQLVNVPLVPGVEHIDPSAQK